MGNKTLVLVYFNFRPPCCDFDALDVTSMSLKEYLTYRRGISESEIDKVIINPTIKEMDDADTLNGMNAHIMSNI